MTHKTASLAAFAVLGSFAGAGTIALDSTPVEEPVQSSLLDTVLGLPTLYDNPEGSFLQSFLLIGRYHGQYYYLDSNQGNADDWDNRRRRLGFSAKFAAGVDLSSNFNVTWDGGRFVDNLEDVTLRFKPTDDTRITVGKFKAPVTHEWRTSSNSVATMERSRIVNQAVPDKMGGVLGEVKTGDYTVFGGVFDNTVDPDWWYPAFDGGFSAYFGLSRGSEFGTTRLDYLYSDIDTDAPRNNTKGYDHLVALSHLYTSGKLSLMGEVLYGSGDSGRADVYGLTILPMYDLNDRFRLVGRYQLAGSNSSDGFGLQSRYEREAPDLRSTTGDLYQALYLGINYAVGGDQRLRLQNGVEFSRMEQSVGGTFNALTFFSGVRFHF